MDYGLIVLGAICLAAGIILNHFFPNRYWIALIALGIILMVIGVILLVLPMATMVLPLAV